MMMSGWIEEPVGFETLAEGRNWPRCSYLIRRIR